MTRPWRRTARLRGPQTVPEAVLTQVNILLGAPATLTYIFSLGLAADPATKSRFTTWKTNQKYLNSVGTAVPIANTVTITATALGEGHADLGQYVGAGGLKDYLGRTVGASSTTNIQIVA